MLLHFSIEFKDVISSMKIRNTALRNIGEPFIYREKVAGVIFCLPFILGFCFFIIIPMINSLYYSFCDYKITKPAEWVGVSNYVKLFDDAKFWKSLTVTLRYAVISVPLKLLFALIVAMLLLPSSKPAPFYRAVYYLPSIMGASVAISILWKRMFSLDGLLNQLLNIKIAWLGQVGTAMGVLILLSVWQFGSSMLIFIASMKQIPQTLYEAAEIDGASKPRSFFKITLPLLSSTIFFNLVMQTINGLLVFAQGQIITSGKPLNSTLFYVLYMYQQAFDFYKVGYSAALGWVLIAIVGMFTLVLFLTKRFWVYEGGY